MKGLKLLLVIMILIVSAIVLAGQAEAATNVYVNGTIPNDAMYQGQIYGVNLTIQNNENFPVRIYSAGVNYDWMKSDVFYTLDTSGSYTQIESNSNVYIGKVMVSCDNTVSTGYHAYYYRVELTWFNQFMGTWINETVVQPGSIYVESPFKPMAMSQLQSANATLASAKAANYSSKRALADISNATNNLNNGWSAYNSNDFSRAINLTHLVLTDLADAKNGESEYLEKKASIDLMVNAVNEKLKATQDARSPDGKDLVNLTRSYLNKTVQNIRDEDFDAANKNVKLAEQSIDSASNAEFIYRMRTNETAAAKDSATQAILTAQSNVQSADVIVSSPSAGNILNDARFKIEEANQALNSGDYVNATVKANVASTLASQAISEEANYRMGQARNKISSIGDLKSPQAKDMLSQANAKYNQSQGDYLGGDYKSAVTNANEAFRLANDTSATEQKWRAENPVNAVPGFGAIFALIALAGAFMLWERKD